MTADPKDRLFSSPKSVKPFEFNSDVALVFDDMAKRSIPFYEETQARIFNMLSRLPKTPRHIYDLGTSTGALLFALAERFSDPAISYIGIDNSEPMIHRAKQKQAAQNLQGSFEFRRENVLETHLDAADVIVVNYVLQFLPMTEREAFLRRLQEALPDGGVLILSEKTQSKGTQTAQIFSDCHDEFRKRNHYSNLEISQKRRALENVMQPVSLQENLSLLQAAGFKHPEPFLVWQNFASIICVKESHN